MIDKSIRADYAIQGGGPNYLGKQKMVRAPKKWQSSPDHEPAELAYITEKEKDILIDLDIYGSLNGKPNRGPSGIISLQGDLGGYGGSGGSSSSGGSGGGEGRPHGGWSAPAPRPAPRPSPHKDDSAAQAEADRLNEAREAEARESAREKAIQVAALTPQTIAPVRHHSADTPTQIIEQQILDTSKPTTPDILPEFKKREITTVTGGSPHTEGPIDRIVYQPTDFPKRDYDPRTDPNALLKRPSGVLGTLGKIALTGLTAGAGAGLFGQDIANVAKLANYKKRYDALQKTALGKKLGLKELDLRNLTSNIDKAKGRQFDPKDPIGWTGEQKRTKTFHEGKGDGEASIAKKVAGGEDVVTKTANQFAGTEVEGQIADLVQNDLNQALKYYSMMTPKIEAGKANKQEMDAYELLGYYLNEVAPKQQNVAYGGRIDKPLTGRSRDI